MTEEKTTPNPDQALAQLPNLESCYSLFLAETSLRQIIWRVATAPELQESGTLNLESGTVKSTSCKAINMTPLSLNIVSEIEKQFSEWLAYIPASAAWKPTPGTCQITPLSSRIRLQYWFGRFHLYKPSLYSVLNSQHHSPTTDPLTLTWVHYAVNAAFNAINVFVSENFIPDDIFAHR